MLEGRTIIVFGIEHYNPLGIIRSLGEQGIHPVFIAIPGRADVASASKYVEKCHRVKDYVEGCQLLLEEYGDFPADNLNRSAIWMSIMMILPESSSFLMPEKMVVLQSIWTSSISLNWQKRMV